MEKIKTKAIEKKFAPKEKIKKVAKKTTKKTVKKIATDKTVSEKIAKIFNVAGAGAVKKKKMDWQINRRFSIVAVVLVVSAIACAGLAYELKYDKKGFANKETNSIKTSLKEQDFELVKAAVIRNYGLLYDEDPVFATVTDIERMRAQQFFVKIENDDKVLIYTKNRRIILFRPSSNKIIDISQELGMNAGTTNQNTTIGNSDDSKNSINNGGEKTVSAKIVVANGARIGGLAQKIGEAIMNTLGIDIAEKTNATGKYKNTLVIDLSGSNSMLAQKIAGAVGGEVATLPEGEETPAADILVIGGSNFKIN